MKSTRAQFAAWCRVAVAVMTGACALVRQPPPAPPRHTNLGLDVSSFALSNGLRVVLVKDPHAAQVQVTMRYQVGAADDLEKPGIAHLVEHLMFQQVLGGQSLFATLEDVTTYFNALTTYDATTYISRAPLARLDKLLSVEAVRLGFRCTSITDSVFTREREVVVNEIRGHDDDAFAAVQRAAYPEGHPYGQTIGGDMAGVGAITREEACKFVDAYYAPSNAVLVISGDLTARDVETALGKFIARISKRVAAAPAHIAEVPLSRRRLEATIPIDKDAVLIAWPMPVDPKTAIKLRAIEGAVPAVIDSDVKGTVVPIRLGDARAPMFGVIIEKTEKESAEDVIGTAERSIARLPDAFRASVLRQFDQLVFDRIQQSAIYDLYASLEDGGDRDARLAAYVLAGRDPQVALASEFAGVREIGNNEAASLAMEYFSVERATVVTLKGTKGKKRGHDIALRPEVHDMGQRRTRPDPALAHAPATGGPVASATGMRTRQLANGLKIVLLPSTSVPTIDVRLVFRTGTADEPSAKRGVALLTAHALEWDMHYLNDMIVFVAAGGTATVDVTGDHTTFLSRGVDMHIDVLLAGLRRWVREGKYGESADDAVEALRRNARKRVDEREQLTKTVMAAMFGADHPYAGGLPLATLTPTDAEQFRAAHYTPDNATLVIAGRFDADLADRWIDYLFADWTGRAQPGADVPRAVVQPSSIAKFDDLSQLYLAAALPISAEDYAQQLVTSELLEELADTIRQELGASYGVHVQLAESRLARMYMIGGWIDASRAKAAVELLRDRVAALRSDPDAAARAFVTARSRVLTRISTFTGSAAGLAESVEHDIDLERSPMSDLQTASAVRDLTIDRMTAALGDLDLSRALVVMRGPEAEVKGAFEALGRTPKTLTFDQAAADAAAEDANGAEEHPTRRSRDDERLTVDDLDPALTDQEPRATSRLSLKLMPLFTSAHLVEQDTRFTLDCCTGASVYAEIGYRLDAVKTIGLQVGAGVTHGSYTIDVSDERVPVTFVPIDLSALIEVNGYGRLWGNISLGIHLDVRNQPDDMSAPDQTVTQGSLGFGLAGGVDLVRIRGHRFGIGGHVGGALISSSGYGSVGIGLVYRQ